MKLDYSVLQKAVESLEASLRRFAEFPHDLFVRDSVIQRFEYTYELCIKMLRRALGREADTPELVDHLSFKELLREALEKGIELDFNRWLDYREKRNISAHTYDEEKARLVSEMAKPFLSDARKLLTELLKRP